MIIKRPMRWPLWIRLTAAAGMLVAGLVFLRHWSAQPEFPAGSEPSAQATDVAPANTTTTPVAAGPVVAAPRTSSAGSPTTVRGVSGSGGSAAMLRIKGGTVLATVNGSPIELKDLLPLPPEKEGTEQTMSAERYAFLLDRAVEREVTFQAASRQGVELTEAQRLRLAELRSRSERVEPGVFDTVQQHPANVDFQQRDSAALLLLAALAEKAGVPSPHVTAPQVQAYYQEHQADYGALPTDAAQRQTALEKIDRAIRQKLAPQLQAEYQERFQQFVKQLIASARVATPTS